MRILKVRKKVIIKKLKRKVDMKDKNTRKLIITTKNFLFFEIVPKLSSRRIFILYFTTHKIHIIFMVNFMNF